VFFGQLPLSHPTRRVADTDAPYLLLRQPGEEATFPPGLSAFRHLVSHVVRRRTESQVERVDTTWHVAKVHHLHAGRDGAVSKFKSKAMGCNDDLRAVGRSVLDDAVPILSDWASPQDAPGFRGLPNVVQERAPGWELVGASPAAAGTEFTPAFGYIRGTGKEDLVACFAGAADGTEGRHDGSPTKGRRVGGPVGSVHRLPQSFLHCSTGPAPLRTEN
jgi:hypothetical protein